MTQTHHYNDCVGHQITGHGNQPEYKGNCDHGLHQRQLNTKEWQHYRQINAGSDGIDGGNLNLGKNNIGEGVTETFGPLLQGTRQWPEGGRVAGFAQRDHGTDDDANKNLRCGDAGIFTRPLQLNGMLTQPGNQLCLHVIHVNRQVLNHSGGQCGAGGFENLRHLAQQLCQRLFTGTEKKYQRHDDANHNCGDHGCQQGHHHQPCPFTMQILQFDMRCQGVHQLKDQQPGQQCRDQIDH